MAAKVNKLINNQDRERITDEIRSFFYEERGEEMGLVAAGQIYDFFYDTLGRDLCRKVLDRYRDRMVLKLEDGEAEVLGLL